MVADSEPPGGLDQVARVTRYIALVDSLVPPSDCSWYSPPSTGEGTIASHRLKQRDMERKIRAVWGSRP